MPVTAAQGAIWAISAVATGGVIVRPWRLPEAIWAMLGAAALVLLALLPWRDALRAVGKGTDVYLFLIGMMLLAELARKEGLFDWLAALAARRAKGSSAALFALVYTVGIFVTVFLSNDATAVVLTPAVYAVARAAKAEPLPYLLICAFVANAASFVLPISNPANLVVFGSHMPPLSSWLAEFALPSILAIAATFLALRFSQRRWLRLEIASDVSVPVLSRAGLLAAFGIGLTAVALMTASVFGWQLGFPTFLAGVLTALMVLLPKRQAPWGVLKDISWSVLPLVAGLFVLVEGLARTGVIAGVSDALQAALQQAPALTAGVAGGITALADNVMNNLPAGLIAGSVISGAHAPPQISGALLIGVDLGPNLSVTGSLATILWLLALRREGENIGAWRFLGLGAVVMPCALLPALAILILLRAQ